jgi:DNA polymerase-3 subunit delta'
MAWSSILGHESVVERLRESLARDRLSHAYLFVGTEGIGKELVARELAKALLCPEGTDEACDNCRSCRKVEHGNHPDLTVVERIRDTSKGAARSAILIDQVREEIQDTIRYKPFESVYKAFVVVDAERLTEQAQNCLLKTLEEPPGHSLLVLVASRLEPFLDTIVSRCQVVRFRPLPADIVEQIVWERSEGDDHGAVRVLARLSGGSPGRAMRCRDEGAYDLAVWLLGQAVEMPPAGEFAVASELLDEAKKQGSSLEAARERLRLVLELLTQAFRDACYRASGYPEELLAWSDDCGPFQALCDRLSPDAARRLIALGLAAREQVDANVNIKLVLENLLLGLSATLAGQQPIAMR